MKFLRHAKSESEESLSNMACDGVEEYPPLTEVNKWYLAPCQHTKSSKDQSQSLPKWPNNTAVVELLLSSLVPLVSSAQNGLEHNI